LFTLLPTPIGNLDDLSYRVVQSLKEANVILCEDTRVTKRLLYLLKDKYNFQTQFEQCIALHSHNEDQFLEKITPIFFEQNVVYMSDAGMPAISDPGAKLVKYCQINNIQYDVIPGANALITAYSASGFEDTAFSFYGFLPHKGKDRDNLLQTVINSSINVVLYESPHRLLKLLDSLSKLIPNRDIFLAKELSKKYQTYFYGASSYLYQQLKNQTIKGEWVVVIKKTQNSSKTCLSEQDIINENLSLKSTSKLIAKITGENPKAVYQKILKEQKIE